MLPGSVLAAAVDGTTLCLVVTATAAAVPSATSGQRDGLGRPTRGLGQLHTAGNLIRIRRMSSGHLSKHTGHLYTSP